MSSEVAIRPMVSGVARTMPTQDQISHSLSPDTMTAVWELATKVADSRLFKDIDTPDKAFTLMMLCEAEGLHPMQALRRYDIIEGRPAMKAQAIQAEFQAQGGRIKILRSDAIEARAIFSHPTHQPDGFEMVVTYEQFEKSRAIYGKDGIKKNWRENPTDMLWWRCSSKGVRKICPGIVVGIPSVEEAMDMVDSGPFPAIDAPTGHALDPQISQADAAVFGFTDGGFDSRPYHKVVTDAAKAVSELIAGLARAAGLSPADSGEVNPHDIHRHLLHVALNLGYADSAPSTLKKAIEELTKVYRAERSWLRTELNARLNEILDARGEEIREKADAAKAEESPAGTAADDGYVPGLDC